MKKPLIVILAGGTGSSFSPLVTNKTLVPFLGKPILQHTIEMAENAGFHEALIITNPENESWLSTYQPFNITLRTKIVRPTGMGDALVQAQNEIGSEPCIILNACDVINTSYLKDFFHTARNTYACITGYEVSNYFPGGYLKTHNNQALDIVEKPGAGNEPSNLLNLVVHYFSNPKEYISILESEQISDDQYENALKKLMLKANVSISTYAGEWSKLKYSFHVLDVMQTLMNLKVKPHIARSAKVSQLASIEGAVYVDEGAIIDSFAVIKGPAYIGKNVRIGNHSLVRESTIEKGSTVGFGSEVVRSYIGPGCMLHQNFVGDTVLEANVNPSWGTTFANWRTDKQPVKLKLKDKKIPTGRHKMGAVVADSVFMGVNCSIMPGVTIGQNAKIYPGQIITSYVDKQEAVSDKQ